MPRLCGLILLLLVAPAWAQQRRVHENGTHVWPRTAQEWKTAGCTMSFDGTDGFLLGTTCVAVPPVSTINGATGVQIFNVKGAIGQDTTGAFAGGDGGPLQLQGGTGGNAPGGGTNGTGGSINIAGGVAGTGAGTAGNRGNVTLIGRSIQAFGQQLWLNVDGTIPTATVTSDGQALATATFNATPIVSLTSDNGTAANRTFTIPIPAFQGRLLILYWSSNTNKGELADTGNVLLSAIWPDATNPGDSMLVLYATTASVWVEVARSKNT